MTRDDIIRMAREAGFCAAWLTADANPPAYESPADIVLRFAAMVAAAEREACAKVANAQGTSSGQRIAEAIRARSNP